MPHSISSSFAVECCDIIIASFVHLVVWFNSCCCPLRLLKLHCYQLNFYLNKHIGDLHITVVVYSMRTGLLPTINTMMVLGLVSIPGMMTGQILGGNAPEQAARYQVYYI